MQLAGQKLSSRLRRSYDEEDAALSAFHSLCRVITERRQADLSDRDNLWRLLVTITERKVQTRWRHEIRGKRDVRRTVGESCFVSPVRNPGAFLRCRIESLRRSLRLSLRTFAGLFGRTR